MIWFTTFLLVVALFNRSAIHYALVMLTVTAMYAGLSGKGMFHLYPYIDAFSVYPLAYLAMRRPTWWGITTVICALVSVLFQIVYWSLYLVGFYVPGLFSEGLALIFLIAVLALLWGSYDVGNLIRRAYRFCRSLGLGDSRHPHPARVSSGVEEA